VIRLFSEHPTFRRRRWFKGRPLRGKGVADVAWLRIDGEPMSEDDWNTGFAKSLMVFLNGRALNDVDPDGKPVRDDSFLLLFNAHHGSLEFTIPEESFGARWSVAVDTAAELGESNAEYAPGDKVSVEGRSLLVLSAR